MNTRSDTLADTQSIQHPRSVEQLVAGQATSDGAGVKLTRVLTQNLQQRLDPFLMLDAFGSDKPDDYIAGFPDHPHRGFETITYMLAGRMLHRDSAGNEGLLENGDVQWMTAGKGVIHSEIPQQEHGIMEGFQLWLNLPKRDKMNAPWYKDFKNSELPKYVTPQGVEVTVIAGESHGVNGAVTRDVTQLDTWISTCLATHSLSKCCRPYTMLLSMYIAVKSVSVARLCLHSVWLFFLMTRNAMASRLKQAWIQNSS